MVIKMRIMFGITLFLSVLVLIAKSFGALQSATLQWDPPIDTVTVGYNIYRGQLDCGLQGPLQPLLDSTGAPVILPLTTTYTDATVPDVTGTFCWEVTARDAGGVESPRSNRVSKAFIGSTPIITPPAAPTNLRVVLQ